MRFLSEEDAVAAHDSLVRELDRHADRGAPVTKPPSAESHVGGGSDWIRLPRHIFTGCPPRPENPSIEFEATEYRVPEVGEHFWSHGDESPCVCQMFDGMDLSIRDGGKRWILRTKRELGR